MDPRIILAGQLPDTVGAMGRGTALAAAQNEIGQRNALASLYAAQGPGILAGDPQALNALSRLDPFAGQEVQSNRLGMDATRQDMAYSTERMQMDRDRIKRETAEALLARQGELDAAELARLRQQGMVELSGATAAASQGPQAWAAWSANDPDWAGVTFDQAKIKIVETAATMEGLDEVIKLMGAMAPPEAPKPKDAPSGYLWNEPGNPAAGVTRLPGMAEPGPQVVVNNGGSDKQIYDSMEKSADVARTASVGLRGLVEAEAALNDDAGIITGAFADQRLAAAKLGALFGVTDPQVISNTETLTAAVAPQVAAMVRAVAGSANISNSDREFAERAAGGNIKMDAASIQRLFDIGRRASEAAIAAHKDKLNRVYPEGQGFDRERALFGIGDGPAAPSGKVEMDGFTIEEFE